MGTSPPPDQGPKDERLTGIAGALMEVGIAGTLAEAYARLLWAGPLTAAGLTRTLGCARSHAYRLAKALVEEGLAAATLERPVRYEATPPERVVRLLDARDAHHFARRRRERRDLVAVLNDLVAARDDGTAPLFRVVEGEAQRTETFMVLAAEARRSVDFCTTAPATHDGWARPHLWTILGDATVARVRRRVLLPDTREMRGALTVAPPPPDVETRLATPAAPLSFLTADGAAAVIARSAVGARRADDVALWTTAPGVVHTCDLLFRSLWADARPWRQGAAPP